MFDGRRALFPTNPFDDHIQFLRDNNTIPKSAIEYGIEIGLIPHHPRGIDAAVIELESIGYKVIESMHGIDPSAFTAALDDWNARAPAFFAKMKLEDAAIISRCDVRLHPKSAFQHESRRLRRDIAEFVGPGL